MPVVQRIQRLYSFAGSAADSAVAAYVGALGGRRKPVLTPERVCAGGLLAADMMAFAMSAIVAGLTGKVIGGSAAAANWLGEPASLLALGACILAGMAAYLSMHEHNDHRVPFWTESRDLVVAAGMALVAASALAFLLDLPLPRLPLLGTAALFAPASIALRRLARWALDAAGLWRVPVVVVGDGPWATRAIAELATHAELGYDVVARVAPPENVSGATNWNWLLRQSRARLLVLATENETSLPAGLIAALVRERVPYALLPQMNGLPVVGARRAFLGQDSVLVSYRNNLAKPLARGLKIAFDLAAASAALLMLAPVMLVIAALVGLDGGPVLYAHSRIGVRGRVFRCLKFRSMVTNGDEVLQRVLAADEQAAEEWARTHKLRRDPRVTWIGRILRKTSLDELPQLLNVLRLEMSLVGPRPIVSLEIPKYAEDIAYYYETRPGITGLWQVSGRSDTSYAQRVRLDSWYVKNWTLWQDLAILARTIPAVVSGRGAG